LFVTVIVFADFVPTTTVPNNRLEGERLTATTPVRESRIVCKPGETLSTIVTVPVFWPVVVGFKETLMAQVPPGETVAGHVVVWPKEVPVTEMDAILREEFPVFFKVTEFVATEFRATLPKEMVLVERLTL
jgi:hypothetical protein